MTNDDLISRQAAIDEIEYELEMIYLELDSITLDFNTRERLRQRKGEAREILNSIQQLPSAQPERETAKIIRWMEYKKTDKYISYTPHCKCSKCGNELLIEAINYCYMCGADLRGEQDE